MQGKLAGVFTTVLATVDAACTRILWNGNGHAVMVGRRMDRPESTEPVLTRLPRGMTRNGVLQGVETVVAENASPWTSQYGSLVTSIYDIGTPGSVPRARPALSGRCSAGNNSRSDLC